MPKSKQQSKGKNGKHPGGRPEKYRPEMCATALELMRNGSSKKAVAAALDINRDTLYQWEKKYPELSDTIKKGEELSEVWWEEKARANIDNKSFNSVLWLMNMKCRFGLRDTVPEQNVTNNIQYGVILLPQPKPLEEIIAAANQRSLSAPVGGDADCPAHR